VNRLSRKVDLHDKEINSYYKKLSQYLESLVKVQQARVKTQLVFDMLFELSTNTLLAQAWSKSGKLTDGFKKHNKKKKALFENSKSLQSVDGDDDIKNNIIKAVEIIGLLEREEREVSGLIDYANNQITQGNLRIDKEKESIYVGVNAFFVGEYASALDRLLNADVSEPKWLYYKNLFISAAYFYLDETLDKNKAIEYKLKARKLRLTQNLNDVYFSPKFVSFYNKK